MTNLDSVLERTDVTLQTKVHIVKAMVFPVITEFESWTIKKIRLPKNWCFQTVVLEKTPESPLDTKEIKAVNVKGNQPWILVRRLLKLKLQYFGHLMWTADLLEKSLMLGKIEGRRRGHQRMRWLVYITKWTCTWANSGRWWGTGRPGMLQSMQVQTVGHNWATEQQLYIYSCLVTKSSPTLL